MAKVSQERMNLLKKEKLQLDTSVFLNVKGKPVYVLRQTPLKDNEMIAKLVGTHFIDGNNYVCDEVTHAKPCKACSTLRALAKANKDVSDDVVKALTPQKKYWMKVVCRPSSKVYIYRAPYAVYSSIFDAFDTDQQNLSDTKNGCDFRVKVEGTGLNTRYSIRILEDSPLAASDKAIAKVQEESDKITFDRYVKSDPMGLAKAIDRVLSVASTSDEIEDSGEELDVDIVEDPIEDDESSVVENLTEEDSLEEDAPVVDEDEVEDSGDDIDEDEPSIVEEVDDTDEHINADEIAFSEEDTDVEEIPTPVKKPKVPVTKQNINNPQYTIVSKQPTSVKAPSIKKPVIGSKR